MHNSSGVRKIKCCAQKRKSCFWLMWINKQNMLLMSKMILLDIKHTAIQCTCTLQLLKDMFL